MGAGRIALLLCLLASLANAELVEVREADADRQRERLSALGFELLLERYQRLERVGATLRLAAEPLCDGPRTAVLGVVAVTFDQLPLPLREAAFEGYGVDDLPRILWVDPDLAADRAGVLAGDTLLSIDGRQIDSAASLEPLRDPGDTKPMVVELERDGDVFRVNVDFQPGCTRAVRLEVLDRIDAFSDDDRIVVYTGMLRFVENDDELAVILAHELAHQLLGHEAGDDGIETDADRLGLQLTALAGYDVSVAEGLVRRMGREFPHALEERVSHSHPGAKDRAESMRAQSDEILDRLARGEPLEIERP